MAKQTKSAHARWSVKIGLVCFSVFVTLVLIEIILRASVEDMPLNFSKYLPIDVKIISQTTKNEFVPESYVALLGDSYAAGWGDWYLASLDDTFGNPPFHSADIIHSITGLNILTFARPGQGSFDGIAYFPRVLHRRLVSRGIPLSDPSVIVVYFYEGNDLHDNLHFLRKYWNGDAPLTVADVETLVETISAGDLRKDGVVSRYLGEMEFVHKLYVAKFLYILGKDLKRLVSNVIGGSEASRDPPRLIPVRVGGKPTEIPGPVESPPVHMSEAEIARAVSVFEASLRYLMDHYSRSDVLVVYLPSPIMSYQLDSAMVPIKVPDASTQNFPVSEVERISDIVCRQVADTAARLNAGFLDTRPPIRAAGRVQTIHGPLDWYHFNEVGYRVLGSTIAHDLMDRFGGVKRNGSADPATEVQLTESRCAKIAKYDPDEEVQMLGSRIQQADWD